MAKITTDGSIKRNKKFEKYCLLSQSELKARLCNELRLIKHKPPVVGDGWLFSDGELPIIICAHMDTVHKELPKEVVYQNGTISSPQGIGGDDRCGIYMAMQLAKKHDVKIMFFEDEELGCEGAEKFILTDVCKFLEGNINFVIELDRAHSNDSVFYQLDNPDFEKFINTNFWKTASGSFTDICTICPALECAGVNLSVGYYNQHSTAEYVDLRQMEKALAEVSKLIERTKPDDKFEYKERVYHTYGGNYGAFLRWSGYDFDDYGIDYNIDIYNEEPRYFTVEYLSNIGEENSIFSSDDGVNSDMEALAMFFMENPTYSFNQVIDFYEGLPGRIHTR